jgi:predicted amidohydrolase
MSHLAIAGLQLELEIEDNLALLEQEIDLVKKRFPWIQMVVLPELCTFGPSPELAVVLPGEVEQTFCEAAARNRVWLIPGSLFERREGRVFNSAPVIDPQGRVVARHRKHYPFLPYEKGITGGEEFTLFEVPGAGKIGLIICYDQWFPEVVRQLVSMGAEAIICPNLTNTIDRDVELAIARANAATNQVYFMNVNAAGRMAMGRSIVCGPDGAIIHQAGSGREVIAVEIDFAHVRRVRERGLHSLCQTLKSFRDTKLHLPVYGRGAEAMGALNELGPLSIPGGQQHDHPDWTQKQA